MCGRRSGVARRSEVSLLVTEGGVTTCGCAEVEQCSQGHVEYPAQSVFPCWRIQRGTCLGRLAACFGCGGNDRMFIWEVRPQLRAALSEHPLPSIPFIGMYLTDLTFIEDGNPDYSPDNPRVVFFKKRMVRFSRQRANVSTCTLASGGSDSSDAERRTVVDLHGCRGSLCRCWPR